MNTERVAAGVTLRAADEPLERDVATTVETPVDWPGDRGGHVWPKDREVVSPDGTRVRYTVRGAEDGPWLVFCAGFLCPDNFWQYLAPALFDTYRCLFVNYRGVGASTVPDSDGLWPDVAAYQIEDFARDVLLACEVEGVADAAFIGHSMGCQVALSVWRQEPDRVAGLALLTGPFASPLSTFYGTSVMASLFPVIFSSLWLSPRFLTGRILPLLTTPLAMPGARFIRALGPLTPGEGMALYFAHAANVDPRVAAAIANGMHTFDAGPWLTEVDVPVLVVTGGRDTFSPPELGHLIEEAIEDVTTLHLEEGTHGALLEFPNEIRAALQGWLTAHQATKQ